MIRVLLQPETQTFSCICNITDIGMRQQMEALMGGYGIIRGMKYPETTYSGPLSAFEWFKSIFQMYGFQVSIFE